jgi:photosystem II stability/assembly factor-like uncharacterized protein
MKARLLIWLVFMVNLAFSQNKKPVLESDFKKWVIESDAYFQTNDRGKGSGFKQYMRQKFLMANKVDVDGILRNFTAKNQEQYDLVLQKNKNARTQYSHGFWEDLGPNDYYSSDSNANSSLCRVNCIAFHPTDVNIIWVGTPLGGLWKTTNQGVTWICITNNFASCGISDIVVHPTDPNQIWVMTGDGDGVHSVSIGVIKTNDGGLTWKSTGLKFNLQDTHFGYCLRMHPSNPNLLLAGTNKGMYKTINGGDTWEQTSSSMIIWDIEFKPNDPTIVYAASSLGVLKSTTAGTANILSSSGFPTIVDDPILPKTWARLSLAISPSAPNNVYVLCGGVPSAGTFSGLYKSTDQAVNWTRISQTPNIFGYDSGGGDAKSQAGYDICLTVDPTNDARIFMGGINCWRSNNSGATWSRETNYNRTFGAIDPFVHADWHMVKFNGNRLYGTTDGGVWYTDDYGHSWGEISSGIGATQFYNIDIHDNSYVGGTQDNGTNEGNFGNMQMHNIEAGDGFGSIWHKTNFGIKFITTQGTLTRRQDGINWTIKSGDFWFTILKNATNTNQIFFFIQDSNKLIRGNPINDFTINEYSFYDCNNLTPDSGLIKGYSQGTDNAGVMYVAHENKLLKTTNIYGATTASWANISVPDASLYYDDIITDPANSQRVWVVCGGYQAGKKVFRSTDGGTNWVNISGTLPNVPFTSIALQAGGGDKFYLGSDIGMFYKSAGMTDWAFFSNGLPNVQIQEIRLNSTHVVVGTFGRGIWRSELFTTCPATLALTPANETITNIYAPGTQVHSADVTLTSTRQYSGSVGTNIYYNAPQFVELKTGFEIKKDAFMEVKNKGCPN